MFAGITGASAAPAYAVPAAPPAATSALGRKPVVATTTTTTVPPTTTTLLPLPTTPGHGPGPNPGGPTPSTTSTSIPAPTTTVSPQVIDALVRSVQNDLAQVDAIAGYDQDKGIVTANEANAASADSSVDAATRAERDATARVASGEASVADTQRRLAALAVALYVRSDMGQSAKIADPSVDAMVN
ncbi:MAG: hypothetical protein QOK20_3293, partial [Acidimicrobiaceae bacterium]|nr:hypothetical protein [Acidimicrobiaceae bacterium]